MGLLVEGVWQDRWYDTAASGGRFIRSDAQFRNWVTRDGAPGPTGQGGFAAEPGRYHLYIARACPWAHRTMIFRVLKGLEGAISYSVVHWRMAEQGWTFEPGPGVTEDHLFGASYLHQVYTKAEPLYSGRVTVPVLWDKATGTIVSNESAEIIRMLNSAFDGVGAKEGDYYPPKLREEIDAINSRIYDTVNNGVYKAGFATSQEAYEEAVLPLFGTLDWLEDRLSRQRYLCGAWQTEADWRLFPTLLRFDPVYVGHFKCNLKRLVDYPNLWSYTRELYQAPGIPETVDFDHIKRHYYQSHTNLNPSGVVPLGPVIDFTQPASAARGELQHPQVKLVVVGHAHAQCLEVAAGRPVPGLSVEFLQLRNPAQREILRRWSPRLGSLPAPLVEPLCDDRVDAVVLVLFGNAHNLFALAKHPEPFDFLMPGTEEAPPSNLPIVSYGLVRRSIERAMAGELPLLEAFCKSAKRPVSILLPPPPLPEDVVRGNPRAFNEKLSEQGLSPMSFRVKCWQVQCAFLKKWAAARGISVIDVPEQLIDEDGSLLQQYSSRRDPTQGNSDYGREILKSIQQLVQRNKDAA